MLERTLEYLGVEKELNIGSYYIAIKLKFYSTLRTKFCTKFRSEVFAFLSLMEM